MRKPKTATASPDPPRRRRGRPRKVPQDAGDLGDAIVRAETATELFAISKRLARDTVKGEIGSRAADSARALLAEARQTLKLVILERAMRDYASKVVILTDEEFGWLEERRAKKAPEPVKPGENVQSPMTATCSACGHHFAGGTHEGPSGCEIIVARGTAEQRPCQCKEKPKT